MILRTKEINQGRVFHKSRLCRLLTAFTALTIFSLLIIAASGTDENPPGLNALWVIKENAVNINGQTDTSENRVSVTMMANLVKYYDTAMARMFIFNMESEKFWLVKYRSGTIAEGTFDDLKNLFAERRKKKQTELKNMENSQQNLSGIALERRRTHIEYQKQILKFDGERFRDRPSQEQPAEINGHKSAPVNVFAGKNKIATIWIALDVVPSKWWKDFNDLMADIEPERWKIISAAQKIPLKVIVDYGKVDITWEPLRVDAGPVSVNDFILPEDYSFTQPSID